ncbi:MAG: hypothetical protein Q27BB25_05120 [Blastomonas sp. CACIA14H2]|nr:MAG: hypothetical protein Q27BB25_05120 [Blastomonas sp. CACIA14H2]
MIMDNEDKSAAALNLLTNRVLFDFISLQVDAGRMTVAEAKALVRFSADEVIKGAPDLHDEVKGLAILIANRFDETDYGQA